MGRERWQQAARKGMPNYEIVVTYITNYGSLYCVAGWDLERRHMIRPEPPGANAAEASKFWGGGFAGPGKIFSVGNAVRFKATRPPADFLFPHATEDRIVAGVTDIELVHALDIAGIIAAAGGSRS